MQQLVQWQLKAFHGNKTLVSEIIQTQQSMWPSQRNWKSPALSIQLEGGEKNPSNRQKTKGFLIILDISIFVCLICDALMNPNSQKKMLGTCLLRTRHIILGIWRQLMGRFKESKHSWIFTLFYDSIPVYKIYSFRNLKISFVLFWIYL